MIIIADQLTKILVVRYIGISEQIRFIPYFLNLTHTENKGASFGLFTDQRWVFMSLSVVAILLLGFLLFKYGDRSLLFCTGISMILGGGMGNMIDRVFRPGGVVDFFEFDFINFAIFNVADMFITAGTFLFLIYLIFLERKSIIKRREITADENTENGTAG